MSPSGERWNMGNACKRAMGYGVNVMRHGKPVDLSKIKQRIKYKGWSGFILYEYEGKYRICIPVPDRPSLAPLFLPETMITDRDGTTGDVRTDDPELVFENGKVSSI
jgi:hypothetical protein